jgi:hypothetical protein
MNSGLYYFSKWRRISILLFCFNSNILLTISFATSLCILYVQPCEIKVFITQTTVACLSYHTAIFKILVLKFGKDYYINKICMNTLLLDN